MKKTVLINPFERVAGWQALGIGLVVMALTAVLGKINGLIFDGVFDAHMMRHTYGQALAVQGLSLVSLIVSLWLAGLIFSKTKFRLIDIAGTAAFARIPLLAIALLAFLPIIPTSLSDTPRLVALVLICMPFIIWMMVVLYNGYSVSCNIKGTRAVLSFIGAVVVAEVISKLLIIWLVISPLGESYKDFSIPEGQTIQQSSQVLIEAFSKNEFNLATAYFDDVMKEAVPTTTLAATWMQTEMRLGKLLSFDANVEIQDHEEYRIMLIPCEFEKGSINIQFAFNEKGEISGMYFK